MRQIRKPSLTPKEAFDLHHEALVIDAQQPPATRGFLYTPTMKTKLTELSEKGYARTEASSILAKMALFFFKSGMESKLVNNFFLDPKNRFQQLLQQQRVVFFRAYKTSNGSTGVQAPERDSKGTTPRK